MATFHAFSILIVVIICCICFAIFVQSGISSPTSNDFPVKSNYTERYLYLKLYITLTISHKLKNKVNIVWHNNFFNNWCSYFVIIFRTCIFFPFLLIKYVMSHTIFIFWCKDNTIVFMVGIICTLDVCVGWFLLHLS